jgi:hypothetical protein
MKLSTTLRPAEAEWTEEQRSVGAYHKGDGSNVLGALARH